MAAKTSNDQEKLFDPSLFFLPPAGGNARTLVQGISAHFVIYGSRKKMPDTINYLHNTKICAMAKAINFAGFKKTVEEQITKILN